jgi:hypothetical protein
LNPDCSPANLENAGVGFLISLVIGIIWIGIGFLIRGKPQPRF